MILVIRPGSRTTVQDEGRFGFSDLGVPRAGAADSFGARLANRLVGNDEAAAVVEITAVGPTIEVLEDLTVALVGADAQPTVDSRPVPMGCSLQLKRGSVLDTRPLSTGARAYLALGGAVDVPTSLGSRSTDTLCGLGPPPLHKGDRVGIQVRAVTELPGSLWMREPPWWLPHDGAVNVLRVVPGPDAPECLQGVIDDFASLTWTVRPDSDRTGIRLESTDGLGADLTRALGGVPSKAMVLGAVQLPPSGQPIVLLANHAATGGYPVAAVVIRADIPRAAQLRPGDLVQMRLMQMDQANVALRNETARLKRCVVNIEALCG